MRRRQWDTTLYALADGQAGYFTAGQAREAKGTGSTVTTDA